MRPADWGKTLSLLLCLLFLFGQTAVTRVLCCSPQQGKNLEFAFFGIECDCNREACSAHSHDDTPAKTPRTVFDPACSFCFDIPFSDVFTAGRSDTPPDADHFHGIFCFPGFPAVVLSRPRFSHFQPFPVSKFLPTDSQVSCKTLIRC
jgi:hypothetical protein